MDPWEVAFIASDDSSVFVIADKGAFVVCDERFQGNLDLCRDIGKLFWGYSDVISQVLADRYPLVIGQN